MYYPHLIDQMDEYEPLVKRKSTKNDDDIQPMDSSQQQQIIDHLTKDYQTMVKHEKIQIIFALSVFLIIHLYLFFKSSKINFILNSIPLLILLISKIFSIPNFVSNLSLPFEIISIFVEIFSPAGLKLILSILLHFSTLLMIYYNYSSQQFAKQTPQQIIELEKKKYNYKVA